MTLEDGRKFLEDPANIAHLVEFGTQSHALAKGDVVKERIQKGDIHPGARPYPYMRPAWDEQKGAAEAAFLTVAKVITESS